MSDDSKSADEGVTLFGVQIGTMQYVVTLHPDRTATGGALLRYTIAGLVVSREDFLAAMSVMNFQLSMDARQQALRGGVTLPPNLRTPW